MSSIVIPFIQEGYSNAENYATLTLVGIGDMWRLHGQKFATKEYIDTKINIHTNNHSNPHLVTAEQLNALKYTE